MADQPIGARLKQQRPSAAPIEIFLALYFIRAAAGFELVVLVSGLNQIRQMPCVIERALSVGLVALMEQSGSQMFQNLCVVGIAREHRFAEFDQTLVVVGIDGGFYEHAFQFRAAGRIGEPLQMIFDSQNKLGGAVAGFAERFLEARLLVLGENLRAEQRGASQEQAYKSPHWAFSCGGRGGLRMASAMVAASSREICR
jgi:hypothetical protein